MVPKSTASIAFAQWCIGDTQRGIPPLRALVRGDMPNAKQAKRFSDLQSALL